MRAEDEAPRGFVPMREYLRLQRRVDELEEQLACRREDQREEIADELLNTVRVRLGVAPQCAIAVITVAHAKSGYVTRHQIHAAMGRDDRYEHYASVIVCKLNQAVALRGAPKLIEGRSGPNGFYGFTPAGRAWCEQAIPELFTREHAR